MCKKLNVSAIWIIQSMKTFQIIWKDNFFIVRYSWHNKKPIENSNAHSSSGKHCRHSSSHSDLVWVQQQPTQLIISELDAEYSSECRIQMTSCCSIKRVKMWMLELSKWGRAIGQKHWNESVVRCNPTVLQMLHEYTGKCKTYVLDLLAISISLYHFCLCSQVLWRSWYACQRTERRAQFHLQVRGDI